MITRVMFNRQDEPYHRLVRTVIIQPPDCCERCTGRVECLILERVYSCHIKVEWYVPKRHHSGSPRIKVWKKFNVPDGYITWGGKTDPKWRTDDNNGKPIETYATHLDENFERLTGVSLEEYEAKLGT